MNIIIDILNMPIRKIESAINDVNQIVQLEKIEKHEKENKNRKSVRILINKRIQRLKLEKHGYNYALLKQLLDVPFHNSARIKERIPKRVRKQVLERDNYICQLCYKPSFNLNCHHIDIQGNANEENLISLCDACHSAVHKLLTAKGYKFFQR